MKKISTLTIILLVTLISEAQQIPKGTILLGGTVGFNKTTQESSDPDETRSTNINFSPSFGKFYKTNRVAGINLNYARATINDDFLESNYYGIGFFLRQYLPLGKSFYVFAEENIYGQTGKSDQLYNFRMTRVENKTTTLSLNIYPGVAYAISRKFQAELALTNLLSLGYITDKSLSNTNGVISKLDTKNFALNAGTSNNILGSLSVGAKWFLSKR